jgi:futalosine hydrolase
MKLLIVAATEAEIKPTIEYLRNNHFAQDIVEVLITGVGMVATTFALTKKLQQQPYDLVLQAGVGGSFDKGIPLGSLVFVTSERFGDLGAEDHENYIDIFDMGLIPEGSPFTGNLLQTPLLPVHDRISLPMVSGLTINTVSGRESTIELRTERFGCQVESMEGAALHYACLMENMPFAQVRAISNYVIPRDKSQWQMKDAIINLNRWLTGFIAKWAS